MKRFVSLIVIVTFVTLWAPSANALDVPAPDWALETGVESDFGWGTWFPCLPEYRMDDCIESATWLKSDGSEVAGKWIPKPDFDYKAFKQTWVKNDQGSDAQDVVPRINKAGAYKFEGLVNPCGNDLLDLDVRPTRYSMQAFFQIPCGEASKNANFAERMTMTIKSSHLGGKVGGVTSNGRQPEMEFFPTTNTFKLTSTFAYIPWPRYLGPGVQADTCKQNQERATRGVWTLVVALTWLKQRNDPFLQEHPTDIIGASNGWNCGGFLYWDYDQKALVMAVGAPHFDVDGTVVEGWFEGRVRGRYLTSRYGISPEIAAGQARLEITYDNGDVKVATVAAKYDKSSDWLTLNGYGFTYSNPTLIIRFDVKPKEASIPISMPIRKMTVICVKGKTTKKVTAVKPVCPKGYKRK